ncbi:CDP-alcohol phosphatidyltransferase family protein [Kiritimatiellaeota bacterium B1221]|nr:CDP-alcohol phosphatidyltransferase family protein [Kiritimatiellaeota bacterium B1221]
MQHYVFTIPNLISFIRILLAPILFTAGMMNEGEIFLWAFAGSLVTDFLDGFLARLLNQQSKLGAQLDTVGDVLTGISVLIAGYLIWPDMIMLKFNWILVSIVALTLSGSVTLIKYRHLPSYHTWSAKCSTAILGLGIWAFFAGITEWGLQLGILILTISALEEVVITLILPEWRPNVPHIFYAIKLRHVAEETEE